MIFIQLENGAITSTSSMVMVYENLTHLGNEKELEIMCINLLELDLAYNHIEDLNEVLIIFIQNYNIYL